ncbi:MAG: hypothetical protein E7464_01150 [Ruminococcaceae bacterium]|nr:hypothetical protein [Oscillospiraceae bacterium]
MKHNAIRIIAMMLVLILAMNPLTVFATDFIEESSVEDSRASNYISSTYATVTNTNGRVEVYFRIIGTGTMNSIGAAQIQLMDSSGTTVKTFNYKTTSGMMSYSTYRHFGSVFYSGSASTRYTAIVTFQASNNSGSDNRTFRATQP